MFAAAEAHTPVDVLGARRLVVEVARAVVGRPPSGPPFSSRSTRENALSRSPWPNTRSWSYLMPRWPLRSMWKSLPCHSAWAMPCGEVQPGHLLVPDLGVEPDELGVLERGDERQRVADRGQQDVAARLVRLGLDREPDVVALVDDVLGEQVHGLAVAVEGGPDVLGRVVLGALAAAPHHVGLGAQLGGQVEVAQHLAQREAAHVAVVAGEAAVLEHRVGEQVGGHHRDDQAGLVERLAEPVDVARRGPASGAERRTGRRRGR